MAFRGLNAPNSITARADLTSRAIAAIPTLFVGSLGSGQHHVDIVAITNRPVPTLQHGLAELTCHSSSHFAGDFAYTAASTAVVSMVPLASLLDKECDT